MKTKDIASQYGIDKESFEYFLRKTNPKGFKDGLMGMSIADEADIKGIIESFNRHTAEIEEEKKRKEKAEADEKARLEKEAAEKQVALASMLITSGFSFDGYTITKYSGYISGDDAIQIDRGTSGFFSSATDVGENLMSSLVKIRRKALQELKEAAYELGCNAVIGVDFDYLTLEPETASSTGGTVYLPYVFGVTANGNAVIIEKNDQ